MLAARANTEVAGAAVVRQPGGGGADAAEFLARHGARGRPRGFGVLTGAGFDGLGFVSMFDKLQQASRHNDDGSFPYLRSHPLTGERIADMRARLPLVRSGPPVLRVLAGTLLRPARPAHGVLARVV